MSERKLRQKSYSAAAAAAAETGKRASTFKSLGTCLQCLLNLMPLDGTGVIISLHRAPIRGLEHMPLRPAAAVMRCHCMSLHAGLLYANAKWLSVAGAEGIRRIIQGWSLVGIWSDLAICLAIGSSNCMVRQIMISHAVTRQ